MTFYQFMMTFRDGNIKHDEKSKLANWMFSDHNFPKHSTDYEEISRYLETYSPFLNALSVFDEVWDQYELKLNLQH